MITIRGAPQLTLWVLVEKTQVLGICDSGL